ATRHRECAFGAKFAMPPPLRKRGATPRHPKISRLERSGVLRLPTPPATNPALPKRAAAQEQSVRRDASPTKRLKGDVSREQYGLISGLIATRSEIPGRSPRPVSTC